MDAVAARRLRFEGFTLDLMRRSLRDGEREVELRAKSFDALCYLAERAGRLVTKDEIIGAVWPNVAASDDSLARCISDVRQALRDSDQRIIKTVTGRGYVFAAPVSPAPLDPPVPELSAPARRGPYAALLSVALAAAFLLVAAGWGVWHLRTDAPAGLKLPERPSIAVLPFANMSGDADQDYFSDGVAQDLSTSLSKFGELFVVAHRSAARYKGRDVTGEQIGRELGVRYLLQGSVRKDAGRLRITAELVEAGSGAQIWGERYDREQAGIFTVQDDMIQQIVARLVAQIGKSEFDRTMRKAPGTWAAYDHYLRGNAFLQHAPADTSGATIAAARNAYERSLAADPRFAPALRGLAAADLTEWLNPHIFPSLYPAGMVRAWYDPERLAVLDRIARTAQQAIDLDPGLAEAYATLGFTLHWRHGPAAGMKVFARAFELNPNLVEGRYSVLLAHGGRAPEAVDFMKRIMRLDPFYPPLYTYFLGKSHFFAGEYEEAIVLIRAAADRLPGFRPVLPMLATVAALTGRDEEARAAAVRLREIQPDFSIGEFLRFMRMVREEDAAKLAAGLRKAGLPD